MESYLEGVRYDFIRAALAVSTPLRPLEILLRIRKLEKVKESPLLADAYEAYRRVVKILPEGWTGAEVQESLLREKEEVALWNALRELEGRDICIQDLADLKRPLDDFFNRVLVMEKDERLKANRLALLTKAKNLFNRVADFSKLVL